MGQVLGSDNIPNLAIASTTTVTLATTNLGLSTAITIGGQQYVISSPLTLTATTTGVNGLDVGVLGATQIWYVYAIVHAAAFTPALVASLALPSVGPAMPSGYSAAFKEVGVFNTNASNQIIGISNDLRLSAFGGTTWYNSAKTLAIGSVSEAGVWTLGPSTITTSPLIINGTTILSGTTTGSFSIPGGSSSATDANHLAYYFVNTFKTGGSPIFQYAANKNGAFIHGWGTDANGNMVFGLGTAATGLIDSTLYATVTTAGNWGFGTSSAVAKLHISGSGLSGQVTSTLIIQNISSGTLGMDITGTAGNSRIRFLGGGGPGSGTNSLTEYGSMILENNSNNGGSWSFGPKVGTSGATHTFWGGGSALPHVNRVCAATNGAGSSIAPIGSGPDGSVNVGVAYDRDNGFNHFFYAATLRFGSLGTLTSPYSPGTLTGTVTTAGVWANISGTWTTISDSRLKTNVANLTGSLAKIVAMRPVSYDWIQDNVPSAKPTVGFIAQEMEAILPNIVVATLEEYKLNDEDVVLEDAKHLNLGSEMIAHLVGAIKELKEENEVLKARIDGYGIL